MSVRIGFTHDRPRRRPLGRAVSVFSYSQGPKDLSFASRPDLVPGAGVIRRVVVGLLSFRAEDLEAVREAGARLRVTVIGVLRLPKDVSPELADAVFEHRRVIGVRL
ncbi:MAG TPA: hypothetical protein VE990_05525 [Acidimicrobiales bacterium]|nr:hypothetical protein [Acidimicrobiales bacterium]